jgi:3-deoxy-D-manno-octulosonic-acid transferase
MQTLLFFFYTIGIHLGNLYVWVGKYFSTKLSLLWHGRRQTLKKSREDLLPYRHCIWMHCASLGEFEQGRPMLESLRHLHPEKKIVLTFFSPSGYEIRKTYPGADLVMYLPSDLPHNALRLVTMLKPDLFILVKYEFWWHLLNTLRKQGSHVVLVAGIFRKKDYFFSPVFSPFESLLRQLAYIFVQDDASFKCLEEKKFSNVFIAGDTRVDRVLQMRDEVVLPEKIMKAAEGNKVMVYGSVWLSDMHLVSKAVKAYPGMFHILVPHDIRRENIAEIMAQLQQQAGLLSDGQWHGKVLVVDQIGILASLYSVAAFAYIGGGFGKAIHNLLEPAVFGIPVFMGPRHTKFTEAIALKERGVVQSVQHAEDLVKAIGDMADHPEKSAYIRNAAERWFTENKGATSRITQSLAHYLKPKI